MLRVKTVNIRNRATVTSRTSSIGMQSLTVDVNVAADVGAAEGVGDVAGNGFGEEGVVHDDLVRVSGDLLDYASPFGPPVERMRRQSKGRR